MQVDVKPSSVSDLPPEVVSETGISMEMLEDAGGFSTALKVVSLPQPGSYLGGDAVCKVTLLSFSLSLCVYVSVLVRGLVRGLSLLVSLPSEVRFLS